MHVAYGLDEWQSDEPTHVAIGTFDGVHRGHQALLRGAVAAARAQGGRAVALTFDPHPLAVLAPDRLPPLLGSLDDRLALLAWTGIDTAVVARFDAALARMEAREFARRMLAGRLRARTVFVGFNFQFGRGGLGSAADLERWGPELGFRAHVVPPVQVDRRPVSSTWIRRLLEAGDVAGAAAALGRLYSIAGIVRRGEGRGAGIGFPTANLSTPPGLVLPAEGVYAVWVAWNGRLWPGVANIGRRPTFGGGELRLEVHLLDVKEDLYGQSLRVGFVRRLREERRFSGPDELAAQIREDVRAAREWLREAPAGDPLLDPAGTGAGEGDGGVDGETPGARATAGGTTEHPGGVG
ncbi:MAG: bifunctional riboflavin kinase/FAD synthetase [Bacillota bacterium]|nr:MAG: bifunctional riboflavin kinase/FAD synthetase [Bacillota bacterium]